MSDISRRRSRWCDFVQVPLENGELWIINSGDDDFRTRACALAQYVSRPGRELRHAQLSSCDHADCNDYDSESAIGTAAEGDRALPQQRDETISRRACSGHSALEGMCYRRSTCGECYRSRMKAKRALSDSLYDKLAESPAPSPIAGRTNVTRAKETIDNDMEEFAVEAWLYGS